MEKYNDLKTRYTESLALHEASVRQLRRRGHVLVAAQLVLFGAAVGCAVGYTLTSGLGLAWTLAAAALLAGYFWARRTDGRHSGRLAMEENVCAVYRRELAWLQGDFSAFGDGSEYVAPGHEYTFDMDIFGPQSLYQRTDRCVTQGGADALAHLFATCASGHGEKERIDARREAVLELAGKEEWRAGFMAHGISGRIDTRRVTQAVAQMRRVAIPRWLGGRGSLVGAWLLLAAFYVWVLLSLFTSLSASVPVWWGIGLFCAAWLFCKRPLCEASGAVDQLLKQMKAYLSLIEAVASLDVTAADNRRIQAVLGHGPRGATASFRALGQLLDAFDRRGNLLGLALSNVLFLSDYFLVRRFLRWRRLHGDEVERWIEAVGEMDARVSMATFCHNHGSLLHEPSIVEADGVVLEAEAMAHPFLGAKAVPNDFTLRDGHFYIVTGANMAGKSTFLRSLGVNYILAMAGMPVFAGAFKASVFALFSSMRTSDDLAHGISYFNAELRRLGQLLGCCRRHAHTLIILDEILRGTNSMDKLNGSRLFLEAVARLPVTGVIATHDLELSKMADEHPARFHNHCFEIALGADVTYSYKITPGVARNQNATFLLRRLIDG